MKNLLLLALLALISFVVGCSNTSNGELTPPTPPPAVNLPSKPYGLCFGPFVDGSSPDQGAVPTVATVNALLTKIKAYNIEWIRIYTCAPLKDSTESMASLAKAKGFKVAGGCWLSKDLAANTREVNYLIAEINKGNVDLAVVGSEVLLRNDLTSAQLINYIKQVKVAGKPVTTADTYAEILAHSDVVAEVDKIMVHIYPFWEGKSINQAFEYFKICFNQVKNANLAKEVIVGETGWASAGNTIGQAVPNQANSLLYLEKVLMWSKLNNRKVFYFEAFDEPWKTANEGEVGAHWGLWTSFGELKPGVLDIFKKTPVEDQPTLPEISIANVSVSEGNDFSKYVDVELKLSGVSADMVTVNWSTEEQTATKDVDFMTQSSLAIFQPGTTATSIRLWIYGDRQTETDETYRLVFTNPYKATLANTSATITLINDDTKTALVIKSCPAIGGGENVIGECWGINPVDYRIVVYIKVNGGWWIKPYYDSPLTPIRTNGGWSCDVTTGGIDSTATDIAVYQVNAGYTPPTNPANLDPAQIFLSTNINRNAMPTFPIIIEK